jgi:hypothetical protein
MSENGETRLLTRLRALLEAVAEEARINPAFAAKAEASLALAEAALTASLSPAGPQPKVTDGGKSHTILQNVTFDPLECHIEAALIGGREQEARDFLGKLNRTQLDEVVNTQRLPGAKGLHKTISEEDAAAAIDAIVGSAAGRVRSRFSASR